MLALPGAAEQEVDDGFFRFEGDGSGDGIGYRLATGCDATGDGYEDLLVGALSDSDHVEQGGAAFFLAGPLSGQRAEAEADYSVFGLAFNDNVGSQALGFLRRADGCDLLVGTVTEDTAGQQAGSLYSLTVQPGIEQGVDEARMTVRGELAGDHLGGAALGQVDFTGDGLADLLVGAKRAPAGEYDGRVYLINGERSGEIAASDADVVLASSRPAGRLGFALASAGDQDGDGHTDLLVSAYQAETTEAWAGEVYLLLGPLTRDGQVGELATARISGTEFLQGFGSALSLGGDVDGDGQPDVLVAAMTEEDYAGGAYLFTGPLSGTSTSEDARAHFLGEGPDQLFGWSLQGGADIDADGFDDILVSAPYWDGGSATGKVSIWFGGAMEP